MISAPVEAYIHLLQVARHEHRSLLGAAQPYRRFAASNGDFPIKLSDKRIVIARAEIKSRRGGGPPPEMSPDTNRSRK